MKAKVSVADFDNLKEQFLLDIKAVVEMEEIPLDLIVNWDQTGMHYVRVSSWTVAKERSKRVEISGVDDKRQITAVFGCSMAGDFFPCSWYTKCHPSVKFTSEWHIL